MKKFMLAKKNNRLMVSLFLVNFLLASVSSFGQIPEGEYQGSNPTVNFTVANQTTITNFSLWVSWPAGSCGGSIPISRSSITISDTGFSISYSSSSRVYSVDGTFHCGLSTCGGNYSMWDRDPFGTVCTKSGTWNAEGPTSIEGEQDKEIAYKLVQNYPNPFNPVTVITFTIPEPEFVTLDVYNALGRKVATLMEKKINTGTHDVQFDASTLPSGIYFYRIQVGNTPGRTDEFSQVKKMVLLR